MTMGEIVHLPGGARRARKKAPPKPQALSQYERYLLPFMDRETRSCWAVHPSGHYDYDCAQGGGLAIRFLKSCDGSVGWSTLLGQIVMDMIRAGDDKQSKGLIIGFMSVISRALIQERCGGPPLGPTSAA
jgi:hypothetical protein